MNAVTKGDMMPRIPVNVEYIRVRKGFIIPVPTVVWNNNALACLDQLATDLEILCCYTAQAIMRNVEVPQQFLNGTGA